MRSIYTKLLNIQNELKAPKSQYNTFGKFYYRNCEDIQEGLKPLLVKNNATIIISDEIVQVDNRIYVKATVSFIDVETGESITNTAFAREEESKKGMDGSQVTGATSSYARKYALNGLFCIDDSRDPDNDNKNDDKESLITEFQEEIKRTKKSKAFFLGNAKVTKVEEMKINDLKEAINALKQCPTKE